MLGHQQTKCRHGERYDDRTVKSFENWLERMPEFRRQVGQRMASIEDKQAETQARKLGEAVREILDRVGPREQVQNPNPNPATTQLIKARWPPVWVGQKFDKWKLEVEKWKENNRSTEEDKFVDLLESLKKNDTIKEFVTKTLVDKIGDVRTVD